MSHMPLPMSPHLSQADSTIFQSFKYLSDCHENTELPKVKVSLLKSAISGHCPRQALKLEVSQNQETTSYKSMCGCMFVCVGVGGGVSV